MTLRSQLERALRETQGDAGLDFAVRRALTAAPSETVDLSFVLDRHGYLFQGCPTSMPPSMRVEDGVFWDEWRFPEWRPIGLGALITRGDDRQGAVRMTRTLAEHQSKIFPRTRLLNLAEGVFGFETDDSTVRVIWSGENLESAALYRADAQ